MYGGNGSDLTICHRDCPSGCAGFTDTRRIHGRRLEVEWKNAIAKESHEQVAECDSESLLALSIRQKLDAEKQLRDADRSDIQGLGDLLIQPSLHAMIAVYWRSSSLNREP